MNKKLALIKWYGGKYDKTYSSGVPIEWIRGFNVDMYLNDDYANSQLYLVDWKNPKTPPPGGWEIGEAYVIYVSDKCKVLNNKLALLNGVNSPLKLCSEVRDTNENTTYRNENCLKKIPINDDHHNPKKRKIEFQDTNKEPTLLDLVDKLKYMEEKFTTLEGSVKKLQNEIYGDKSDSIFANKPGSSSNYISKKQKTDFHNNISNNYDEKIEIGEQGSEVFVSDFQWATAASSLSFSDMATSLLMACFSLETLLHSKYTDKSKKVDVSNDDPLKKELDSKIISAIKYSVSREFKSNFSELAFKRAIRRKLCHLQREPEVSDSDDDETSF